MKLLNGMDAKLTALQNSVASLQKQVNKMAASIDDIIADVSAENTTLDSLDTAINGIQQMLKDALANETIPPAVQAKIDSVFATVEANKAKLAKAMTDSVPPAPTPTPTPTPTP